jgi:hypothetical protein
MLKNKFGKVVKYFPQLLGIQEMLGQAKLPLLLKAGIGAMFKSLSIGIFKKKISI